MGDITSPKLIILKGFLFLLAGTMAGAALLLEYPTLRVAFLLALTVWCFARFYYFAFYVIEHYVDPSYKFAGLGSFALYLIRRWRGSRSVPVDLTRRSRNQEEDGVIATHASVWKEP